MFGEFGWAEFATVPAESVCKLTSEVPPEAQLSLLGPSGLAAWVAVNDLLQVTSNDLFLVHPADRTVGAIAGQIARHRGARVVGAGYDAARCQLAIQILGFDHCVNVDDHDRTERLEACCGEGVTAYLEAGGGPLFSAVFPLLRPYARVALYGLLEKSFDVGPPAQISAQRIIAKRATLHGLVVQDHLDRWDEWVGVATAGLKEGWLRRFEDVSEGLEQIPSHYRRMMDRKSFGRPIVKLA